MYMREEERHFTIETNLRHAYTASGNERTNISEVMAAIQQILPRCRTVVEKEGGPIKEYYG
jgi:hypothetical protein